MPLTPLNTTNPTANSTPGDQDTRAARETTANAPTSSSASAQASCLSSPSDTFTREEPPQKKRRREEGTPRPESPEPPLDRAYMPASPLMPPANVAQVNFASSSASSSSSSSSSVSLQTDELPVSRENLTEDLTQIQIPFELPDEEDLEEIIHEAQELNRELEGLDLEKALEQLANAHKTPHHIAYELTKLINLKFLASYFEHNGNLETALKAAKQNQEALLQGQKTTEDCSIANQDRAFRAWVMVADYANPYYVTSSDLFKIERRADNQLAGPDFYAATLASLQETFKSQTNHPLHSLTKEQLQQNIQNLLPSAKGLIAEHFWQIIQNKQPLNSVPVPFREELKNLVNLYHNKAELPVHILPLLERDLHEYLQTISKRYLEYIQEYPNTGSVIELLILAEYYDLQINIYNHIDNQPLTLHPQGAHKLNIFYALSTAKYYALRKEPESTETLNPISVEDYLSKASKVAEQPNLLHQELAVTSAILALNQPASNLEQLPALSLEQLKNTLLQAQRAIANQQPLAPERPSEQASNPLNALLSRAQNSSAPLTLELSLPSNNPTLKEALAAENAYSLMEIKLAALRELKNQNSVRAAANLEADLAQDLEANEQLDEQYRKLLGEKLEREFTVRKWRQVARREQEIDHNLTVRKWQQIARHEQEIERKLAEQRILYRMYLEAVGLNALANYKAAWTNFINTQRETVEHNFKIVMEQIDSNRAELNKAYQEQLTAIDKYFNEAREQTIRAYRDYERQVREHEEACRRARKKRKRKMWITFGVGAIAAFVAPFIAGQFFAYGTPAYAMTTGALTSAMPAIARGDKFGDILTGAALGGLLAGANMATGKILDKVIKDNQILRDSLHIAAKTGLRAAFSEQPGNVLKDIGVNIGAHFISNNLFKTPEFPNKDSLTPSQFAELARTRIQQDFTESLLISAADKKPNILHALVNATTAAISTHSHHQVLLDQREKATMPQISRQNERDKIFATQKSPKNPQSFEPPKDRNLEQSETAKRPRGDRGNDRYQFTHLAVLNELEESIHNLKKSTNTILENQAANRLNDQQKTFLQPYREITRRAAPTGENFLPPLYLEQIGERLEQSLSHARENSDRGSLNYLKQSCQHLRAKEQASHERLTQFLAAQQTPEPDSNKISSDLLFALKRSRDTIRLLKETGIQPPSFAGAREFGIEGSPQHSKLEERARALFQFRSGMQQMMEGTGIILASTGAGAVAGAVAGGGVGAAPGAAMGFRLSIAIGGPLVVNGGNEAANAVLRYIHGAPCKSLLRTAGEKIGLNETFMDTAGEVADWGAFAASLAIPRRLPNDLPSPVKTKPNNIYKAPKSTASTATLNNTTKNFSTKNFSIDKYSLEISTTPNNLYPGVKPNVTLNFRDLPSVSLDTLVS